MASRNGSQHSRRPGRTDIGASWISYSDMMAALLLVFILVLCYSVFQYLTMMDTKTQELDAQQALLNSQQATLEDQTALLAQQQQDLEDQEDKLLSLQANLDTQQADLETSQANLVARESELKDAQAQLADQQNKLDAANSLLTTQQAAMDAQQLRIDDLIGMRTRIIQDLSTTLQTANLQATVDSQTGNIVLNSAVFFETNSDVIRASGQQLLDEFIPVYLSVLLRPEYSDYLGEIIIEGHTDTSGSYLLNLRLSQQRALAVATYCLQMDGLSSTQLEMLRSILTAKGKSYSNPVYNSDGSINMDASRRVEFKFSLKDAEMIDEMNKILSSNQ